MKRTSNSTEKRCCLVGSSQVPQLVRGAHIFESLRMAGLRIGVLVGDREQMRAVRRVSSPYNVNAVALACLPEALADQDYIQQYVAKCASRARGWSALSKPREFASGRSQANFVLVRVGSTESPQHSSRDAAARNSGARSIERSRLRRLRAHHARSA